MAIREFPRQRPFMRNNTALFRELRPGVAALPHAAPILADAFEAGTEVLPKTIQINEDLADVFEALADFSSDPLVRQGVRQLTRLSRSLRPTLRFLTPDQTTCNYATLFFRNVASLLSEGDAERHLAALPDRRADRPADVRARPEQRGRAVRRRPRTARGRHNHLHSNPYPNTAAPGQTQECEARQRALRRRADADRQPGRQPGH